MTSRPAQPTTSSTSQLLQKTTYTPDGDVATTVDPQGLVTSFTHDALGRLTDKVENSAATDSWADRWTQYTYTPAGQIKEITARSAGDPPQAQPQVTTYIYGVTTTQSSGSKLASNRLVYQIDYPQDDGQTERETFGYNRQGETIYKGDIAGNVHKYAYFRDGSLGSDVVDTLITGFDGTVRSIWRTNDDVGRLKSVTSRAGTGALSTPLNGVLVVYDKYGQVLDLHQEIAGAATTGSRKTSYAYNYPTSGGVPGLRLATTTYPNGLQIATNYTVATTDYYLSRPTGRGISGGATLFANTYLGAGRVVKKNHPTPQVDWTVTLDRFARIATLKAIYTPYNYNHNSYEYGYNYNSQVTYRKGVEMSYNVIG
jgi:YD repeat-containing protein